MNHREPTLPLDPEERALAERLAKLGPHGEPSPKLDAQVLAAAHAATTPVRRTRRHLPLQLGVAASIALALGLAWQLRPLPGADATRSAANQAPTPEAAPATASTPAMAPARPERHAEPAAKRTEAPAAPQLRAMAPPPAPPAPPPPSEEPAVVFDVAAPPAQAMRAQAAMQADAPEADVPPATVASPEVRDAWLERIRTLAAAGHADEARKSLQEFQRRYPDFALPDDLRPLLP